MVKTDLPSNLSCANVAGPRVSGCGGTALFCVIMASLKGTFSIGKETPMSTPPRHTRKVKSKPYFKLLKAGVAATAPWSVPDLCTAYNWPTNLAGGGVIAIVELGGGWVKSDIGAFFQTIGPSAAPAARCPPARSRLRGPCRPARSPRFWRASDWRAAAPSA